MTKPLAKRIWICAGVLLSVPVLVAVIIPMLGKVCDPAPRMRDMANLRQIGQASLVYATEHDDRFPEAADIWDYAGLLAESGLLDDSSVWLSRIDPATASPLGRMPVLAPDQQKPRSLNPDFRSAKPCFAVALGKLAASMPDTTPLAWTRGLQADGTWAKHSPYGGEGGFIVFTSSHVVFYRTLVSADGGELVRFDGKGPTANILEALPPGCRIGEYVPTPAEQSEWAKR